MNNSPITTNDTPAGQSPALGLATGSAPSLRDILPPGEIIEAAEKVRVWMETNGYRHRWILGGVCSRDHSERLRWWIKNAEDIAKERGELFRAGENMAAELCQWCPHEMRGEVLRAWDAAAEPIRQMKRDLSPQNQALAMYVSTYHECPHCGFEIEVEIEVNEDDGDLPDNCPECGKPLNADPSKLTADAMGNAVDSAHDAMKD